MKQAQPSSVKAQLGLVWELNLKGSNSDLLSSDKLSQSSEKLSLVILRSKSNLAGIGS